MKRRPDKASGRDDDVDQRIRQFLTAAPAAGVPAGIDEQVLTKIGHRRSGWRAAAAALAMAIIVAIGVSPRWFEVRKSQTALVTSTGTGESELRRPGDADDLDRFNLAPLAVGPPVVSLELLESHQSALLHYLKALKDGE